MSPEEWLASQQSPQTEAVAAMSPEEWLASNSGQSQVAPLVDGVPPSTTPLGVAGAVTRGLAPVATGASLGAVMGLPFAGVGAVPGAIAGAGAGAVATTIGDPIVGSINSLLGTNFTLPTVAMEALLTRLGVPEAKSSAERIIQTATAAGSGAGGMASAGKALEMAATSPIARGVGSQLATMPSMQVASGIGAGASSQTAQEMGVGPTGQMVAAIGGGLLPASPQLVRMATQRVAQSTAPTGASIIERQEPTFRESAQSIAATVKSKLAPEAQEQIAKKLAVEPDSVDVVRFIKAGTQIVPDNLASDALKQGWKEGAVASIKAATDQDRSAMTKMLNIFKMGEKSEKFRAMNRPADILGNTVDKRVKYLISSKKNAGSAIEDIANTQLRGKNVNYDSAINTFLDDMGKLGIKVELGEDGVARAILQNSDLQGDRQAQRILNSVLDRLSDVKSPDAYGVHTAKRFIDTQVSYGKQNITNPLSAKAESILKGLRRNLNKVLGDANPDYRAANTKYSETKTALDDMQKAAGTKLDFDSPNADKAFGTAMRRLLSNYGSRTNMIDALDNVNQTASKYGMKIDDDVVNQLIFVNEMDRMFGAAADMSLKGQMSQALKTGVDVARGNAVQRAFELAAEKAQSLRGVNRENAIKTMEQILKRKP